MSVESSSGVVPGGIPLPVGSPEERLHAIFKAYDVRGLVGEQLDAPLARAIGAAFARYVAAAEGVSEVVVARDMRPSGVELVAAFVEGATAEGVSVVDVGLASTDVMYFASGRLGLPGAMFTASHNPAAYNGIKMCLSAAKPIGDDSGLREIRDLAADLAMGRTAFGASPSPGTTRNEDMLDAFVDHARSFIDVSKIRPGLKIVADTANGMGGLVAPAVLKRLPVTFEILFPELARALTMRGAEVLLHSTSEVGSPRQTPKDVAKLARAIENLAFVISANSASITGTDIPAASTDGKSQIVDFNGRILVEAGLGESMVANAEIDIEALRRARRRPGMPNLLARNRFELWAGEYERAVTQHLGHPASNIDPAAIPDRSHFMRTHHSVIERLAEAGVIG